MVDTKVNLSNWILDNPIIPASGTFGYGVEFSEFYDINCLGSFSFKGTTEHARTGNPTPRICECPSGMINSVGLQNPGIDHVLKVENKKIKKIFKKKVIANISGFSVEEYVRICKKLNDEDNIGIIEVNISCPNVHGGGMSFGTEASLAAEVTKSVKAACTKPIYIKLSPNVTNITEIAKACEAAGADGISMINTITGMRIDLNKRRPILANTVGGISGPALFPIALKMVYETYKAIKIPIIGMGGISTADDVIEMMLAGASAVQIGAANLVNPFICRDIILSLPEIMEKYGIDKLSNIIGGAHNG